jgi:hypothetical protein
MKCVCVSPNNNFQVRLRLLLPQASFVLSGVEAFDKYHTTAEPPIIHGDTQSPLILLRIVDFNRSTTYSFPLPRQVRPTESPTIFY